MSLCAIIPVSTIASANQTLAELGHGEQNFVVATYGASGPTHAGLHAWEDSVFIQNIKSIPGVLVNEETGDPVVRFRNLVAQTNSRWGENAPVLPTTGNAVAGTLYNYNEELWWCIQTFNRSTFSAPPATYPALIRRIRRPDEVLPWKQPIDQFDAYKLNNPFTGKPDKVTHNGQTWVVVQADGAGNNVWQPGVFGWAVAP
jgi:hypothetical protein